MTTRRGLFAQLWAKSAVLALCTAIGGSAWATGPVAADIKEETPSLKVGGVIGGERPTPQLEPAAPEVAGCPIVALVGDGSTSGNERAPNSNFLNGRSVWLITAAEAAANGLTNGMQFSSIGFHYATAPGVAATGNLTVYLQNTADTVNNKSTTWTTAITGMTTVSTGSRTLPNTTAPFDLTLSNPAAFTYTGGALYIAFDWNWAGPATTAAVVACNTALTGGLKGNQAATPPATIAASNFRPETRLTPSVATVNNDLSVDFVISYGSVAKTLSGPQTVQAIISNKGVNAFAGGTNASLAVTGADSFADSKPIPALAACGGQTTVTFSTWNPTNLGSDTVTVSTPAGDDVPANSTRNRPLDDTNNLYSYKHPGTVAVGGVGLTGATGAFLAKFNTTQAAKVTQVSLEFPLTSATTYRIAIYPAVGSVPGTTPLYLDAADRTVTVAGPVTITLPTPVAVGPGLFFAGVHQTNTTNAGIGFDAETPIRAGSFYLATPNPPTSWVDFAPGNNFKLNIGVTLTQCTSAAECNDNNQCTDDACTNNLCTNVVDDTNVCTDGNACTVDTCIGGVCNIGANPCEDNNACTQDVCDGMGGACSYPPTNCDDGNPCTDDSCNAGSGCAHANNTAACSDGNPCTFGDVCGGGACIPGSGPLPAPVQFCNNNQITIPASGTSTPYPSTITVSGAPTTLCRVTVDLNGISHTFPDDIDVLLARAAGNNAIIMSDVGGGTDIVNVSLNLADAAATSLPDSAVLTTGTFKPTNIGTGDAFAAPAPTPTGGSTLAQFNGGNPNGAWNLWVVDQFTPDAGTMAGWCVNISSACGANAECSDGNPCTDDVCTNGTCGHSNNTVACNDSNACTDNDTCSGGVCVGGAPPSCTDGDACTADSCNAGTGLCEHAPLVCNDGNSCTDDTCVGPTTGCVYTPNDNNACSDGSVCTATDACVNGTCVGSNPTVCNDNDQCTTDSCNPATGACVFTNNTNACDDGNACTEGDACGPRLGENFDGVTAPDIPEGWTATLQTGVGGDLAWYTDVVTPDSPPNTAFGEDPDHVTDNTLDSPEVAIASASAKLTFKNRFSYESTFDGGVLEISINGGAFADIVTAGGSFGSGGYTGVISTAWMSPIGGRNAWTGVSTGYPAYINTVVNLPAAAAGQNVVLRWRAASDSSVSQIGQDIDTVSVVDPNNVCSGTALNCDDNNPCTTDSCDPQTGCVHVNSTDACDDGNACTSGEVCSAGSCGGGTATVCNDGNPCTDEVCDPQSGVCIPSANSAACDDGNPCTAGDVCALGSCQPGAPITAPPEVNGLVAPNKTTFTWGSALYATQYDAVRGGTSALPVGPGGGDEVCFPDLGAASLTDASTPALGTANWYLVRGENACGTGTYGTQSNGSPRVTTTCP